MVIKLNLLDDNDKNIIKNACRKYYKSKNVSHVKNINKSIIK